MAARKYSNNAVVTSLAAGVTDVATTITVSATTGFPSTPFVLAVDPDTGNQELVLVTGVGGTTLTVTRGYDNTTAVSHSAGAVVRHSHAAIDFRESQEHIDGTSGVHGATGTVVGTSDTQVLTNKDLSSPTNTFPASLATDAELDVVADALTAHEADTSAHGVAGAVVGTTDTQTITNKTISAGSNTISGLSNNTMLVANSSGQLVTTGKATPTGEVVGTTDTQTLSNKTLASSTNADALVQAGTASVTPVAGTTVTKSVVFSTAFSSAPIVTATLAVTQPSSRAVGVTSVTTTGFDLRVYAETATGLDVNWVAVLP